jgi:hypothetical protein
MPPRQNGNICYKDPHRPSRRGTPCVIVSGTPEEQRGRVLRGGDRLRRPDTDIADQAGGDAQIPYPNACRHPGLGYTMSCQGRLSSRVPATASSPTRARQTSPAHSSNSSSGSSSGSGGAGSDTCPRSPLSPESSLRTSLIERMHSLAKPVSSLSRNREKEKAPATPRTPSTDHSGAATPSSHPSSGGRVRAGTLDPDHHSSGLDREIPRRELSR